MQNSVNKIAQKSKNERGAALVMALLMSFLLLAAAGGLIMEASMNSANVTDSTAEQQAYNAAESGIQSAVNALRGGVVLSDANRIDTSKPATDKANKIDFVKAITLQYSNMGTTGNDANARLSRWLPYESGTYADRVKLEPPGTTYVANNGYAYSLNIFDPDHTGSSVTYWTKGIFNNCDHVDVNDPNSACADAPYYPHKTYYENSDPTSSHWMRITYFPKIVNNQDVSSAGNPNVDWGFFKVELDSSGTGAQINSFNRFEIVVNMTAPYRAQRVMRGWIETNTQSGGVWSVPRIIFDSQSYTLQGSLMSLGFGSWSNQATGVTCSVPLGGTVLPCMVNFPTTIPQRVGYEASLNVGNNTITGTMTAPEPVRLVIQSTGYGPRGSVKKLEAIIQKNFFNGLSAPATLTLVGPPCPAGQTCFNPGSSSSTSYSGNDIVSTDNIPPIGTTNSDNLDAVQASLDGQPPHPYNGTVVGVPSNVNNEVPDWLSTPAQMDTAIHSLANTAMASADPTNSTGRFFPSGTTPTTFGDNTAGTGITFCDGDCTFTGDGGGILVVTGQLTLHGNFNFKGLIIVTGAGGIVRSGGGTGILQGNIVDAPYANNRIQDGADPSSTAQFLPPIYDLSGGGNSTVQYNSASLANGLTAVSNFVLGVSEK